MWGRVSEHARKLALLYAVSENHGTRDRPRAAIWARRFVLHQARRMLFMAHSHVAENPFQAECLKFLKKLRDAAGGELSHSVLLKRMKVDAKTFRVLVTHARATWGHRDAGRDHQRRRRAVLPVDGESSHRRLRHPRFRRVGAAAADLASPGETDHDTVKKQARFTPQRSKCPKVKRSWQESPQQ